MAKLSEEKILAIVEAYKRIGTYTGVAKEIGCSPATVKKYCSVNIVAKPKAEQKKFDKNIPNVEDIDFSFDIELWRNLTEQETLEVKELQKEL